MNWLDIVLVCLAGFGFVKGLSEGIIRQVVSLIALLAAIFCCAEVADWLRKYIVELNLFPEFWVTILSYVFGFMLIIGILKLVGDLMSKVIGVTPLSLLNHLLGGLFGLMFMMFFMVMMMFACTMIIIFTTATSFIFIFYLGSCCILLFFYFFFHTLLPFNIFFYVF